MGYTARRSQQYSGADATSDLLVEELPGVLVECKRVQRLNIEEAMQKAASDAAPHLKTPMICHRKNGSEWLVTVRMKDLHTFVERMQRGMARVRSSRTVDKDIEGALRLMPRKEE
jgi:hypothetical protein